MFAVPEKDHNLSGPTEKQQNQQLGTDRTLMEEQGVIRPDSSNTGSRRL